MEKVGWEVGMDRCCPTCLYVYVFMAFSKPCEVDAGSLDFLFQRSLLTSSLGLPYLINSFSKVYSSRHDAGPNVEHEELA